jgi:hypothetical protein
MVVPLTWCNTGQEYPFNAKSGLLPPASRGACLELSSFIEREAPTVPARRAGHALIQSIGERYVAKYKSH